MSKALSVDLRERVAAVAAGASCRAAAARFGVSAASAIRWAALAREAGSVAPGPLGGDRRSARIEAHAPLILRLVDPKSDITRKEIRAELAKLGGGGHRHAVALLRPAPDQAQKCMARPVCK
jgi:transposase